MDTVLDLLDELETLIEHSKHAAFSSKIQVDKNDIYEIISEIRTRLPNELKQAKWLIEERNKILIDAQNEAEEIVKAAEERLRKLVDENEITKRAYEQAAEIIETSKQTSKDMRVGANEYADDILALTEARLKEMIEAVRVENHRTEAFLNENLNIIYENRQELQSTFNRKISNT